MGPIITIANEFSAFRQQLRSTQKNPDITKKIDVLYVRILFINALPATVMHCREDACRQTIRNSLRQLDSERPLHQLAELTRALGNRKDQYQKFKKYRAFVRDLLLFSSHVKQSKDLIDNPDQWKNFSKNSLFQWWKECDYRYVEHAFIAFQKKLAELHKDNENGKLQRDKEVYAQVLYFRLCYFRSCYGETALPKKLKTQFEILHSQMTERRSAPVKKAATSIYAHFCSQPQTSSVLSDETIEKIRNSEIQKRQALLEVRKKRLQTIADSIAADFPNAENENLLTIALLSSADLAVLLEHIQPALRVAEDLLSNENLTSDEKTLIAKQFEQIKISRDLILKTLATRCTADHDADNAVARNMPGLPCLETLTDSVRTPALKKIMPPINLFRQPEYLSRNTLENTYPAKAARFIPQGKATSTPFQLLTEHLLEAESSVVQSVNTALLSHPIPLQYHPEKKMMLLDECANQVSDQADAEKDWGSDVYDKTLWSSLLPCNWKKIQCRFLDKITEKITALNTAILNTKPLGDARLALDNTLLQNLAGDEIYKTAFSDLLSLDTLFSQAETLCDQYTPTDFRQHFSGAKKTAGIVADYRDKIMTQKKEMQKIRAELEKTLKEKLLLEIQAFFSQDKQSSLSLERLIGLIDQLRLLLDSHDSGLSPFIDQIRALIEQPSFTLNTRKSEALITYLSHLASPSKDFSADAVLLQYIEKRVSAFFNFKNASLDPLSKPKGDAQPLAIHREGDPVILRKGIESSHFDRFLSAADLHLLNYLFKSFRETLSLLVTNFFTSRLLTSALLLSYQKDIITLLNCINVNKKISILHKVFNALLEGLNSDNYFERAEIFGGYANQLTTEEKTQLVAHLLKYFPERATPVTEFYYAVIARVGSSEQKRVAKSLFQLPPPVSTAPSSTVSSHSTISSPSTDSLSAPSTTPAFFQLTSPSVNMVRVALHLLNELFSLLCDRLSLESLRLPKPVNDCRPYTIVLADETTYRPLQELEEAAFKKHPASKNLKYAQYRMLLEFQNGALALARRNIYAFQPELGEEDTITTELTCVSRALDNFLLSNLAGSQPSCFSDGNTKLFHAAILTAQKKLNLSLPSSERCAKMKVA